jgi:nicotinamidase-related amidase/type 1 glutamine amidotransferase
MKIALLALLCLPSLQDAEFVLPLRRRVETGPGTGRWHAITEPKTWDARKTAVIVCDMWDAHWCAGASARVAEMAPRMNETLAVLRRKGALVIHCPSDTMDFYQGTPGRRLAQEAPRAETRVPLERWRKLDPSKEPPLPIDDADGGCDDLSPCTTRKAWSRQIPAIPVEPGDAVTDSAEAYHLMRARGVENVLVMGVHTNMCVLGRPFSIRQLVLQGLHVALVRDLTDTMYNSRRAPHVSHFTGTDLVVEHIEKFWCPSVTSADLAGGKPFRFRADARPHLVMVIAEDEYKTWETLPSYAISHLGHDFRITTVFGHEKNPNDLPGVEAIQDADVLLVSVRRRLPPKAQLDRIRAHAAAGKPIVGLRTASHAFAPRKGDPPAGHDAWPEFDRDVLGGNYHNHHGAPKPGGPRTLAWVLPEAATHPGVAGLPTGEFEVTTSLYKTSPLSPGATTLLMGRVEGVETPEPVAWTFVRKDGGRTFYSALGGEGDFKLEAFTVLFRNGILWAAGRK